MRVLDVHAHYYPKAYLELLRRVIANDNTAWGRSVSFLLEQRFTPNQAMWDIDTHLRDMDENGIEMEALSLSTPMSYFAEEKDAVEAAKIMNDSLAEICAKYPKRFKGLASLPLPHTDASLKELDRAINTLGLHGVGLGANARTVQVDDPRILPIYPEIARQKLTVFLHPAIPPGLEEMLDYEMWVSTGFLMDGALATLRLTFSGVFEQNPDMGFIVPHLGTFLLSGFERVAGGQAVMAQGKLKRPPMEILRDLYYDTAKGHPPFWQCAIDTVGIDHIVFGTDYPFPGGARAMKTSIERVNALKVSDAEKEKIFHGTADGLFR